MEEVDLAQSPTKNASESIAGVSVTTTGRLHLGFLDPSGGANGQYGSLGIAIDRPHLRLSLRRSETLEVSGQERKRAEAHLKQLIGEFKTGSGFELDLSDTIPAHAGLGSGTQLALSIGRAFSVLNNLDLTTPQIANLLGRGKRSGIGIGAFEFGGVLFDGGRRTQDKVPVLLSRIPFPENWRILLIYEKGKQSLYGGEEFEAFRSLATFSAEIIADLCKRMVMNTLPAIAEGDFETFSKEIRHLQNCMGEYFARAQGGHYTSTQVGDALYWIESQGFAGVGQSSWGPTGFVLLNSETEGTGLIAQARAKWPENGDLHFEIAKGLNRGACVKTF